MAGRCCAPSDSTSDPLLRTVLVPPERVGRWFAGFGERHGGATYSVVGGALEALGGDGSTAEARLPFDASYDGPPDPAALSAAVALPTAWGVLLVRKGGFAVARLEGGIRVAAKVGRRHVQGRTKAGGQSQQRFARRRDNQARASYDAAADHAARVLGRNLDHLVTGGDRPAVDAVLADPRLHTVGSARGDRWLAVPDPRADVLDRAVRDAAAIQVRVHNAAEPPILLDSAPKLPGDPDN